MPINWNYNPNVEKTSFQIIPIGNYRVRIEDAEESISKNKNEMIKLTLTVSGYTSKLFFYIVFMKENKDITDRNLAAVYESFNIPEGNVNVMEWIGKVGGVKVKNEIYNGENTSKVHYFLNQAQQTLLPAWQEKVSAPVQSQPASDDDIKWDS